MKTIKIIVVFVISLVLSADLKAKHSLLFLSVNQGNHIS
jgi:hypothetical protein